MGILSTELLEFLQQPLPREVPPRLWRAVKQNDVMGYPFSVVFLLFSLPFLYIFFPWHLTELVLDAGVRSEGYGNVTSVHKRMGKYNGKDVYDVAYDFKTREGEEHKGWSCALNERPGRGTRVLVEYVPSAPWINRVRGASRNPFGYIGAFTLLFVVVPAWIIWRVRRRRVRCWRLLRDGALAAGRIVEVKRTNVEINDHARYQITVTYEAGGAQQQASYYEYEPAAYVAEDKRESGEPVGLLYDPQQYDRILVADTLLDKKDVSTARTNNNRAEENGAMAAGGTGENGQDEGADADESD